MSIQGFYAPFAVPLALIFGLLVGSFLNVVIYRIPVMMEKGWTLFAKSHLDIPLTEEDQAVFNLAHPDSRCPKCGTGVKPWQNIPVFSYLLLRGKCAGCHTPISLRYPMVEMLTALMFGAVAWQYGWSSPQGPVANQSHRAVPSRTEVSRWQCRFHHLPVRPRR